MYWWSRVAPLAALIVLLAPAAAQAQTAEIPVQGYLIGMEGTPVNDPALTMTFRIYTTPDGGEALYTETQSVSVDSGHFTAYLGSIVELDATIFRDYDTTFLGIQVRTDDEMAPRLDFGQVPYAVFAEFAGDAASLDGISRDDLGTLVDTWARSAAYDTEEELTADLDDNYMSTEYVPSWVDLIDVPAGFADGIDNDTTYTGDAPISIDDTTISLSGDGCGAGEVLQWDGSEWGCEPNYQSFSAAAPLELSEGEFGLSGDGCAEGDVLHWDGSGWDCSEDQRLTEEEIAEAAAEAVADSTGDTFVRWGATGCPAFAERLYRGFMFGNRHDQSSAPNPLCVAPGDPGPSNGTDSGDVLVPLSIDHNHGTGVTRLQTIECAFCLAPRSPCFVMWGSDECPEGFTRGYSGYGFGSHRGHGSTDRVCIDGGSASGLGNSGYYIYFSQINQSPSGAGGDYPSGRALRCAQCCRE